MQASENSAVSSTDEVWGNIAVPVATIAGQQDVSLRQFLERGTPGLDSLVYQDLIGAYFAAQEAQVLSGSGSSGQMLGILNTSGVNQATAFTAAVTATTFQTKVAGQVSAVASNRLQSPTHIAMHPRRWAWLLSQTDSSGRPLVTAELNGPTNAVSVGDGAHAYGVTDSYFQGLRVVVSAQLPTAVGTGPEDQVIVYRASDLLLWQDGDGTPRELRFEQTLGGSLTVKLVAYGYSAFTAARFPKAVGVVGGNARKASASWLRPSRSATGRATGRQRHPTARTSCAGTGERKVGEGPSSFLRGARRPGLRHVRSDTTSAPSPTRWGRREDQRKRGSGRACLPPGQVRPRAPQGAPEPRGCRRVG